jgi:hypothetical protein
MRVRIVLGLAVLATLVGLLVDMSAAAPRLSGSDHVYWPPLNIAVTVPGGGTLCVPDTVLPGDTASVTMQIGGYVGALPRITATFVDAAGKVVARGALPHGGQVPGIFSLPLGYRGRPAALGTLCLRVGGRHALAFGGSADQPPGTTVDGHAQNGLPSFLYYRPGRETWWQLLGALDERIGLGKSPIFGNWTLPVLALAMLALWAGVVRVLLRELR